MRQRRGHTRVASFSLIGILALASGCSERTSDGQTNARHDGVAIQFSVPWVNRLGRELSTAEIRFYAANDDVDQRVVDATAEGAATPLSDGLGNQGWSFRFGELASGEAGVAKSSARIVPTALTQETPVHSLERTPFLDPVLSPSAVKGDEQDNDPSWRANSICQAEASATFAILKKLFAGSESGELPAPAASADATPAPTAPEGEQPVTPSDQSATIAGNAPLLVAVARECKLPARLVVGLPEASGTRTGTDVEQWPEIWLDGRWVALDADGVEAKAGRLRLRVIADVSLAHDREPFFYICEAAGVSVDPGAVRITITQ